MKRYKYSSEELYALCNKGDEAAWQEVSAYVMHVVARSCWHFCEHEREEIAHDTLLYFLSGGLDRIEYPRAFVRLLKLKAKGIAIDYMRKNAHGVPQARPQDRNGEDLSDDEYFPPEYPDCDGMIFNRQALKVCATLIEAMKKECKEILPLYFRYKVMGLGVGKLAEDLKKPLGTVAPSVHKCLKKLYTHPQIMMLKQEFMEVCS